VSWIELGSRSAAHQFVHLFFGKFRDEPALHEHGENLPVYLQPHRREHLPVGDLLVPGEGRRDPCETRIGVLGPIGLVIRGLVVATADDGLGTGNGLGGGIVAMMVGLIGMALGGLALARSRRTG